jgi:hypothetical protein
MAYTAPDIIQWAKISQPLAAIGEKKRVANTGGTMDTDLHIKLYITRKDVEYEYAQDPASDKLYLIANYLLTLCGIYLFQAQLATGGGGSVVTIGSSPPPEPYDFDVDAVSFIATGESSKVLPVEWSGYNILFVRGHITQSKVDNGIDTSYSWDKVTRTLTLLNGGATLGENLQIFPII